MLQVAGDCAVCCLAGREDISRLRSPKQQRQGSQHEAAGDR